MIITLPLPYRNILQRHPVLIPAVLFAAWLLFTASWRNLTLPDEGRYASIALTMVQQGD